MNSFLALILGFFVLALSCSPAFAADQDDIFDALDRELRVEEMRFSIAAKKKQRLEVEREMGVGAVDLSTPLLVRVHGPGDRLIGHFDIGSTVVTASAGERVSEHCTVASVSLTEAALRCAGQGTVRAALSSRQLPQAAAPEGAQ